MKWHGSCWESRERGRRCLKVPCTLPFPISNTGFDRVHILLTPVGTVHKSPKQR